MSQLSVNIQSQPSPQKEDPSSFRIMIATDTHLGYLENDQIRGDDSFNSFEEILKVTRSEGVDFLLMGGDLFHHHNPSKKTIIRTSNILQKYIYGQKEHNFEVYCYEPNFKNENLFVEIPVFIIHGNHDDPSGFENFSSIDIFSNKEMNYFGKVNNYEKFDLLPILFIKGKTKIALYGIGYIKDERLFLALQNKKVNFHRPEDYKSWFNILIVHQNRFKGHNIEKNKKTYLPESFIPSFFDLVIWGHEHECFTTTVHSEENGFHIYQPGSSIATSLIQAESNPKHIGLLEINKDKFRIIPIKLETQRPFIYEQFELKQFADKIKSQEDIEKIVEQKVVECLDKINEGRKCTPKLYNDLLPLIRLKIEYSGYTIIKMNSILNKFSSLVANPGDMVQFWKKSEIFSVKGNKNDEGDTISESGNNKLEEELVDLDEELRKFVNQEISNNFIEKQKNVFVNPEIFSDYLDKAVNGNERHAIDSLFTNFYIKCVTSVPKLEENELLKKIQPLENPKKDFSDVFLSLIDKEEINNTMLYGDDNDSREPKKKPKKKNNYEINLQSQNNFSGEKGLKKLRQDVSQTGYVKNGLNVNLNGKKNNKDIFEDFDEFPKKGKENFMDKDDEDEKEISSVNKNNISISDDGSSGDRSSSISGKNKKNKKKKLSHQPNVRKKNGKQNYSNSYIDDEDI